LFVDAAVLVNGFEIHRASTLSPPIRPSGIVPASWHPGAGRAIHVGGGRPRRRVHLAGRIDRSDPLKRCAFIITPLPILDLRKPCNNAGILATSLA